MPKTDKRIDAYIAKSAPFAPPILKHLRAVIHEGCPDVEETIKWGMPAFVHGGPLANMAAFKAHATFGFWKASLILDAKGRSTEEAMGQFGRITSVAELPAKRQLVAYVRAAAKLNEEGTKVARPRGAPKKPIPVPADLKAALAKHKAARKAFEGFSPGARREYLEWITEAKQAETRARRIAQAVAWMAEGKTRNWKYQNC